MYSSYDYGAAISENRQLTPKYSEYSVQGHFLRSFPDLAKTDLEDEGAGKEIVGGSNTFWTTKLRNPDSGARFYVVRHTDSTSTDVSQLRLNVTTSHGWYAVPRFGGALTLAGRDSRMVPTDKVLPQGTHLLYTTASTFLAHAIGGTDVLVMHGDPGQDFEASFVARNTSHVTVTPHNDGKSSVKAVHDLLRGDVTVGWDVPASDSVSHATLTIDGRDTLLVLADTLSAYKMYAPTIASGARSKSRFANFWGVGTNETVLVSGAPFVRNASLAGLERDTLVLEGQTNSSTRLSVFAPPHVTQLIWNGEKLDEVSRTVWGGLEADVAGPSAAVANFQPPKLTDWKYADSLPEVGLEPFDDSEWTLANKTKSHNPYWHSNTVQTDGQVLFADEYGYHANNLLWRGAFRSSPSTNSSKSHSHSHSNKDDSSDYVGRETGLTVQLEGGRSFAFSVWLNEVFLGSAYGDRDNGAKEATFVFPKGAVRKGENVVTILQDHMGLEMERGALPIGLQSHGENPEARISRRGQKAPIVTPFADPDGESICFCKARVFLLIPLSCHT